MGMANLDRAVAEALVRAHQGDWGPAGSNPSLQSEVTSETVREQLEGMGLTVGEETVRSILRDLAARDYISLARTAEGDPLTVQKVYPTRVKRDFNLWHIAEEF